MKKRVLLCSLVATIIMTGCGPVKTTSDNASSLEESVTEAPPKPVAITSENIIITDDAADEASEEVIEESTNGIAVDAGDSKILESTIDQITEQLEK